VVVKVNEAGDLLTVAAPVIKLPTVNLLPLYRRLLLLNGEMTGDAAFCLNDYEDAVELRIKRPLRDLDFHEFAHAVESVAETSDRYSDVLAEEFGAQIEAVPAVSGTLTNYADASNPAAAAKRAARARGRHEALATVFWIVGLLAGLAAAYYAHASIGSWWLDFFVLWVVAYFVGRGIPSIITHRGKAVRIACFLLIPALEGMAEGEARLHESLSGEVYAMRPPTGEVGRTAIDGIRPAPRPSPSPRYDGRTPTAPASRGRATRSRSR